MSSVWTRIHFPAETVGCHFWILNNKYQTWIVDTIFGTTKIVLQLAFAL